MQRFQKQAGNHADMALPAGPCEGALAANSFGYRIGAGGELGLLTADGVTGVTGPRSRPIDAALSPGSRYLYVLDAGTSDISAFAVAQPGGGLSPLGPTGGLPAGANGLAVR